MILPMSASILKTAKQNQKGTESRQMDITISGKHMDVGDSLRDYVTQKITETAEKYFPHPIRATVVFDKQTHGHLFKVDLHVHAGSGLVIRGHAEEHDVYAVFDTGMERIAKQLRRYKSRLKDHHQRESHNEVAQAQRYVIAAAADEQDNDETPMADAPVVVAEMTTHVDVLTVGEAVMRMDLANESALMFRNKSHGGVNVVYRRPDGHIGWIDAKDPKELAS